jgi:Resolvase, N terminal domain
MKIIEREIANLDRWQKRAAIETPKGPQRIRGLACSGKTIVLAQGCLPSFTTHRLANRCYLPVPSTPLRIAELQANRLLELSDINEAPVPSQLVTALPGITIDYDLDMPFSGTSDWDAARRTWVITLHATEPDTGGSHVTMTRRAPTPLELGEQAKAVLYLRASTKEQAERGGEAEGFSIPAQREAGYRKADQLNADVEAVFIDAGESARSADRPELQRMLQYLQDNPTHYVIAHKVDRLARNRIDDVEINLAIRQAGATFMSCTENIDESPSGMLLHGHHELDRRVLLAQLGERGHQKGPSRKFRPAAHRRSPRSAT